MNTRPAEADFALIIDFDKTQPRPQRIFQAADEMISAFERFDELLARTIDTHITPVLMLEDIESGSLIIWLRNLLKAADDQALREINWKPQVGQYLVKAKYLAIDFLNRRIEATDRSRIEQLQSDLLRLAEDTNARHMPGYAAPAVPELISSLSAMAEARRRLARTDRMEYAGDEGRATFDLTVEWAPETLEDLYVRETLARPSGTLILRVKKPDYIGASQWEFKHGKQPISARLADTQWLAEFQAGRIDLRPGDALRCIVSEEIKYGFDSEVIAQRWVVEKVLEVIVNRGIQSDLLDRNGK